MFRNVYFCELHLNLDLRNKKITMNQKIQNVANKYISSFERGKWFL